MGTDAPTTAAIVVAGGVGERFGSPAGKQLAVVAGLPVVSHALIAFDEAASIGLIVVVCHPDRLDDFQKAAVDPLELKTPCVLVAGGITRTDSVRNGLAAVGSEWRYVAIHDGARPLILPETIESAVSMLAGRTDVDGVVVGQPSYDTIKEVAQGRIVATPDRSRFWVVQTPQVFRTQSLRSAYERPTITHRTTDDSALVEANGGAIDVMEGPRDNVKVTVAEDLAIVDAVMRYRGAR